MKYLLICVVVVLILMGVGYWWNTHTPYEQAGAVITLAICSFLAGIAYAVWPRGSLR